MHAFFDLSQLAGIAISEWPRSYTRQLEHSGGFSENIANFTIQSIPFECMPTISKTVNIKNNCCIRNNIYYKIGDSSKINTFLFMSKRTK